jgi:hypothetical protein
MSAISYIKALKEEKSVIVDETYFEHLNENKILVKRRNIY